MFGLGLFLVALSIIFAILTICAWVSWSDRNTRGWIPLTLMSVSVFSFFASIYALNPPGAPSCQDNGTTATVTVTQPVAKS